MPATCPRASISARSSPSTPRRWGSKSAATAYAWCSSRAATEPPRSCRSRRARSARPISKRCSPMRSVLKLFHFGRFDIAMMCHAFGVMAAPVYCTKIASKLARTYTDRHGLKDLTRELLGVEISKQQQSSDWGAETLERSAARLRRLRRSASACACATSSTRCSSARAATPWRAPPSPICPSGRGSTLPASPRSIFSPTLRLSRLRALPAPPCLPARPE